MNPVTIEMKVDDVKRSEKRMDICILKCVDDEPTINKAEVELTLTVKANGVGIFEELGVPHIGNRIDVVLKEPAQQTLGD